MDWKVFNDAFETEIKSQEFMIDEAEWNSVIKALKVAQQFMELAIKKMGGHWFEHRKDVNEGPNSVYHCRCGYWSYTRDGVDGHVVWELAKLKMQLIGGSDE